jgi:16S rRNA (guanine(966)-N(2))-methyltransferase RsmD
MSLRISGKRTVKTIEGPVRPTMGRVREALFNMWHTEVPHCRWLDLCSGYGTIGAEALQRGASWVVGIEQSTAAVKVINDNWQRIGPGRFALYPYTLPQGLGRIAQREAPFDLVYLDPPYLNGLYLPILAQLRTLNLLTPNGAVACEHHRRHPPGEAPGWTCYDQRTYGSSGLSFYHLSEVAEL